MCPDHWEIPNRSIPSIVSQPDKNPPDPHFSPLLSHYSESACVWVVVVVKARGGLRLGTGDS